MTSLIDQQPLTVGKLEVKGNRWQAVIIDLDQDPVCRRDWVFDIYKQIIERAISEKVSNISMPLLGVRHACVNLEESLDILLDLIQSQSQESICRIFLKLPENDVRTVADILDELDNN